MSLAIAVRSSPENSGVLVEPSPRFALAVETLETSDKLLVDNIPPPLVTSVLLSVTAPVRP